MCISVSTNRVVIIKAKDKIANVQKELENVTQKLELDQNCMESRLQTWKEEILAATKHTREYI